MIGLLEEDIKTGGSFCSRVVDLAVEVADAQVLLSFEASKSLGLESIAFLESSLLFIADTGCNAASRSAEALLDEHIVSLVHPVNDITAVEGAFSYSCIPMVFAPFIWL